MPKNEISGARLLVDCLIKHNVEYIFGIPGAKIDAVFDALNDKGPKLIVCRHEQNAAFMAACYGRLTGKPGVVLVTSGPGVSNLATGLLTATTEGDPVVAIGGNVPRSMKLKQSHQSTDNVAILKACTKSSVEIAMVENIPEVIENAFRIATAPQSGAAFISVPQDVIQEKTYLTAPKPCAPIQYGAAPSDVINHAATLINQAKQPVMLLGIEASRPENTKAIRAFLKKTPLATIGTYQAAGVISRELLDCFVGRVGLFNNQPGDALLAKADVVLTIGFNPVEYDPEVWNAAHNKKIIHLNYQFCDIHLTYKPEVEIMGDIEKNIKQLSPKLQQRKALFDNPLVKKLQQQLLQTIKSGAQKTGQPIHPLGFIHQLREYVDDKTTVISDVGTHYMWLSRYFFSYQPHHLLFSNGQQTLGVALPWAMITSLVRKGQSVISVSGDGGFLFSAMELETAVREKCHFIHFVWVDGTYNMVLEQELLKYGRRSGTDFGKVDVIEFAKAFGAHGFRLDHLDDMIPLLKKAQKLAGPVLIEVPIDYRDNAELFKATNQNVGN